MCFLFCIKYISSFSLGPLQNLQGPTISLVGWIKWRDIIRQRFSNACTQGGQKKFPASKTYKYFLARICTELNSQYSNKVLLISAAGLLPIYEGRTTADNRYTTRYLSIHWMNNRSSSAVFYTASYIEKYQLLPKRRLRKRAVIKKYAKQNRSSSEWSTVWGEVWWGGENGRGLRANEVKIAVVLRSVEENRRD